MLDPVIGVEALSRNWWVFLLRGLAGILFGIITFLAPAISLAALVLVFGAYALADGVLSIVAAARRRGEARWGMLLLEGVAGIAVGVFTLLWPGITAISLLYLIAAWAIVTGVLELIAAVRLRKEIKGEWVLALGGIVSIAFGVLVALLPGAGALAVVILIGAYALVFGVLLVVLSFRLRSWGRHTTFHHAAPSHA
jgi:uncharacterized membrane protein HdeD (DUF308 family)